MQSALEPSTRYLVVLAVSATVSFSLTPLVIRLARKLDIVRPDAHKPSKPMIPSLGGLAIIGGVASSSILSLILFPALSPQILVFLSIVVINGVIGLVDDLRIMPGFLKTGLTVLSILPIIIASHLYPDAIRLGRPEVPFLGRLRLTIAYWLLLPLAVAGPANGANMLDPVNGVMPITCGFATLSLLAVSIFLGKQLGIVLSLILLGATLGYLPYNKYPARIFSGDIGSLSVGGGIGSIAVLAGLEFVTMVALMPHILNAFYIVLSIRGFKEHREIERRPTVVLPGGKIMASLDVDAPKTLTRALLLLNGEASEKQIMIAYLLIGAWSSVMAVFSGILMTVKL